jgi:hypothetical protein
MIRDESNLNSPKYSFSVLTTILINVRVTFEKLNEKKNISIISNFLRSPCKLTDCKIVINVTNFFTVKLVGPFTPIATMSIKDKLHVTLPFFLIQKYEFRLNAQWRTIRH